MNDLSVVINDGKKLKSTKAKWPLVA